MQYVIINPHFLSTTAISINFLHVKTNAIPELFITIFFIIFIFIIIIFPLPLYFMLMIFYKESVAVQAPQMIAAVETTTEETVKEEANQEPIGDPLKRKFIKIIGGSGLGILLLAIFKPKSAEAAFFGSAPGPGTVAMKDSNDNKQNL